MRWKLYLLVSALFLTLAFASRAADPSIGPDGAEAPKHAPLHVGAMIGIISLPRPLDAEVYVRIYDLFSIGVSYSDFPNFVAGPLLKAAGAKSGSITFAGRYTEQRV